MAVWEMTGGGQPPGEWICLLKGRARRHVRFKLNVAPAGVRRASNWMGGSKVLKTAARVRMKEGLSSLNESRDVGFNQK